RFGCRIVMILIGTPGRRAEEGTTPKWVRNGWSLVGVRSRAETEGVAVAGELLRNNYPTAAMFLEETLFHWLLLGSFHTCSLPSIEAGQRCCTVQALCCKLFLVAAFVSIPFFAVLREWRAQQSCSNSSSSSSNSSSSSSSSSSSIDMYHEGYKKKLIDERGDLRAYFEISRSTEGETKASPFSLSKHDLRWPHGERILCRGNLFANWSTAALTKGLSESEQSDKKEK
ncbi:hypothetical protein V1477_002874, partial [Vespula maculifrons]